MIQDLKIKNWLIHLLNQIEKCDDIYIQEKKYDSYTVYEIVLEKKLSQTKKKKVSLIIEKESKGVMSIKYAADRGVAPEDWSTLFED